MATIFVIIVRVHQALLGRLVLTEIRVRVRVSLVVTEIGLRTLTIVVDVGTIEYREHPGTLNGKEIEAWVDHVVGLTTDAFAKPWSLRTAAGVVQFHG